MMQQKAGQDPDEDEGFYNIPDEYLLESQGLETSRNQLIKTFKPGQGGSSTNVNSPTKRRKNGLPEPPGSDRMNLSKRNKPAKKRVFVMNN